MTKAILVAIAILLSPVVALAHGTMRGCVTDKSGAVLPGVDIVLSNAAGERKVTTDASGCYELKGLPAGIYTVGARLAGFVTGMHEGVKVEDGGPPAHVDFSLCLGGLAEIDWVVWPRLGEAWQKADAVVHVRVTATGPVNSECPNSNFQHTAAVVEILKDDAKRPIGSTVIFVQDKWVAERTPYPVGQELVVFLSAGKDFYWRLSGPYWTFLIDGDVVTSFHSPLETEGMARGQLLAILRDGGKAR